jgi:hypothetical protein
MELFLPRWLFFWHVIFNDFGTKHNLVQYSVPHTNQMIFWPPGATIIATSNGPIVQCSPPDGKPLPFPPEPRKTATLAWSRTNPTELQPVIQEVW